MAWKMDCVDVGRVYERRKMDISILLVGPLQAWWCLYYKYVKIIDLGILRTDSIL